MTLKIGLIGIGYWGINYVRILHEIQLSSHEDIELYFCDNNTKNLNRVKTINNKISPDRLCLDYRNIIPELDAVIVSTPAATHLEILKDIVTINNNIYILCEKPMFTEHKDYDDFLIFSIKDTDFNIFKNLMIGHTYIFSESVKYINKCINNDQLGKIHYISSQRSGKSPIRNDVNCLYDLAYHDIQIINHILNRDISIFSIKNLKYNGQWTNNINNTAKKENNENNENNDFVKHDIGLLSYECNGLNDDTVFVNISVNQIEPIKTRKLSIVGSKKMLVFDDLSVNEKIKIYNIKSDLHPDIIKYSDHISYVREGDILIPNIPATEPLKEEILHFIDCAIYKRRPLAGFFDSRAVVGILEKAKKSYNKQT